VVTTAGEHVSKILLMSTKRRLRKQFNKNKMKFSYIMNDKMTLYNKEVKSQDRPNVFISIQFSWNCHQSIKIVKSKRNRRKKLETYKYSTKGHNLFGVMDRIYIIEYLYASF